MLAAFIRGIIYGLLCLAIFNACTTINLINNRASQYMYVDSALEGNLNLFLIEGKLRGIDLDRSKLTMMFSKTGTKDKPRTVGTCQDVDGRPLVFIDKDFYMSSSPYDQQELVFHELAHCLLDRDHCEVKDATGDPVSLMEPEMVGAAKFSKHREAMINELFKPDPKCPTAAESANAVHSSIHSWQDLLEEE